LKFPLAYNMEFVENRPIYKINFFSNFGKIWHLTNGFLSNSFDLF
jgi:hypothetical protein